MFGLEIFNLDLATGDLVLVAAILFLSFFVNSVIGFGSGSLSMGFLVNILQYQRAVFLVNLQESVSYLVLVYKNRQAINFSRSLWIIVGVVLGILIGVEIIQLANIDWLRSVLGLVIIVSALRTLRLRKAKIPIKTSRLSDFLISMVVGISGSLFNVEGPILASYLRRRISDPRKLRIELIFLQFLIGFLKLIIFLASSIISPSLVWFSVFFIPVTVLGSLLGNAVAKIIPSKIFRYLILLLLLLAGLNLIFG